jgi:hypothetical protein
MTPNGAYAGPGSKMAGVNAIIAVNVQVPSSGAAAIIADSPNTPSGLPTSLDGT